MKMMPTIASHGFRIRGVQQEARFSAQSLKGNLRAPWTPISRRRKVVYWSAITSRPIQAASILSRFRFPGFSPTLPREVSLPRLKDRTRKLTRHIRNYNKTATPIRWITRASAVESLLLLYEQLNLLQ
jgi:hypothetical protein